MVFGGWLGSGGDEGGGKLPKVSARRMQSSNRELPNGTSCILPQGRANGQN